MSLDALQRQLGHQFSDLSLLERALRHSSSQERANPDNERLEFLGDRVLGLVVAEYLLKRFPQAREGELALRLNAVVRRESCADIARNLDLGQYLRLARAEEMSGGRAKGAILSDAMEALIAALYLDGGLETARHFILSAFGSVLEGREQPLRDAKTLLQEWAQGQGRGLPLYRILVKEGPDHAPNFQIDVAVDGLGTACGSGPSRRSAEQAAAEAMLKSHGVSAS